MADEQIDFRPQIDFQPEIKQIETKPNVNKQPELSTLDKVHNVVNQVTEPALRPLAPEVNPAETHTILGQHNPLVNAIWPGGIEVPSWRDVYNELIRPVTAPIGLAGIAGEGAIKGADAIKNAPSINMGKLTGDLPLTPEATRGAPLGKFETTLPEPARMILERTESKAGTPPFNTSQFGLHLTDESNPLLSHVPNRLRPPSTNAAVFNALVPERYKLNEQGAALKPTEEIIKPTLREIPGTRERIRNIAAPSDEIPYEADQTSADRASKLSQLLGSQNETIGRETLAGESGEVRFRRKLSPGMQEARDTLVSTLSQGMKPLPDLYKIVSKKVSSRQFDKLIDDIISSGDIEKARSAMKPAENLATDQLNDLSNIISSHQTARETQDQLVSAEKNRRFTEANKVPVESVQDAYQALSKLKGKYPVISPSQSMDVLKNIDTNGLMKAIYEHPDLDKFEKPRAYIALNKVFDLGEKNPLQPNEIALLKKAFGPELGDQLTELHGGLGAVNLPNVTLEKLLKLGEFTKTTRLGMDIGWPLRQGKFYAGRKPWMDALIPSFKSYISKANAEGYLDDISRDPLYNKAREGGLDITKFGVENPTAKEELAPSNVYDKMEEKGGVLKAIATPFTGSERAQTVGTDLLRMGIYRQQYNAYKTLYGSTLKDVASDPKLLSEAERLNPDNPFVNRQIADEINVHTGRGRLPKLFEPASRGLNAIMYPRMISSNVRAMNRTFNPVSYVSMNPIQRQEALKRLLSFGSIVGTSLALHQLAGSSTSDNPTDSKFLKSKFGNSIVDASGGINPLVIAAARIATGAGTDSKGKPYNFGSFGHSTGSEILENAAVLNRLAPIPSLAKIMLDRQEFGGRQVHMGDIPHITLQQTLEPMLIQDIYELAQDHPDLINGLLASGEDIMGAGLSTNQPVTKEERKQPKLTLKKIGPLTLPMQSQ